MYFRRKEIPPSEGGDNVIYIGEGRLTPPSAGGDYVISEKGDYLPPRRGRLRNIGEGRLPPPRRGEIT